MGAPFTYFYLLLLTFTYFYMAQALSTSSASAIVVQCRCQLSWNGEHLASSRRHTSFGTTSLQNCWPASGWWRVATFRNTSLRRKIARRDALQIKNKAHCGFCWGAFQEAATANAVPRSGAVKPQPASARKCSPQPASARLCSPPPGFDRLRSPQPRLCSPPPKFARLGLPTQKGKHRSWMMAPNALGMKEAQPEGHGGQEPAQIMYRI